MKVFKLKKFHRGWIIGDFTPTLLPTKDFEFMVRSYKKGDTEPKHVHKKATEFTVVISGKFKMNGRKLVPGDIVQLDPGVAADFVCLEDGANAVIKTPSVKGDKYIV